MKYAIISDIHGNLPALTAVLSDARMNGADYYIFLGDYTNSFPFQNEVTEAVRAIPNKTAIRGNHEDYFIEYRKCPPDAYIPKLEQALWWSYRQHTEERLDYLINLPVTERLHDTIYISHSMDFFIRMKQIWPLYPGYYRSEMETEPFSHAEYLRKVNEALLTRSDTMAEIRALPEGVYLFGHNHLQFYTEIEGRLFINPGSCGFPLDYVTRAAYTLLTRLADNRWLVSERRIEYPISEVLEAVRRSGFSKKYPEFDALSTIQLQTAADYIGTFVQHLQATAQAIEFKDPYDDTVWREALASYKYLNFKD